MPNPNNGSFSIAGNVGTGVSNISIEISDMLGRSVYNNNVAIRSGSVNESVALQNVSNGMYILTLRSGSEVSTYHLAIER